MTPAREIVDAQVHLWAADSPERPWPPDRAAGAHGPSLDADTLRRWMAEAGVDRALIVPPSWEGDRNDVALDAAARFPNTFAVMGRMAVEDPSNASRLASWRQQPGMLGLRLTFHSAAHRRSLTDGSADWLWPAAERAGVPLMLSVNGWIPQLDRIAERHPGLRLAIDHLGCAPRTRDAQAQADMAALIPLARHPNVAVKATAVARYTSEAYPYPGTQPHVRHLFDAFGPQRFFWGSDISSLPCTYRQAVSLFTEALPWLTADDLDWVMGRGLRRWLDWD